MGRGRDFRGGRSNKRHTYDGEESYAYIPPLLVQPKGTPPSDGIDAVVKWYKPEKGFGFVELANGSGDAFLHVSVLQSVGREMVPSGTRLTVAIDEGDKGRRVSTIIKLDEADAPIDSTRPKASPLDPSAAVEVVGTVKWYSDAKGMGFVADQSGGGDVYLHSSVLRASNMPSLAEGERVLMNVIKTERGRKAVSIAQTR